MARATTIKRSSTKPPASKSAAPSAFKRRKASGVAYDDSEVHIIRKGVRCDTERRGHATPDGQSPFEIVLDASEGFIPLWAEDTTLRWRFRESSLEAFENPEAAKAAIEQLLAEAILKWEDAAPVKFSKKEDTWDFEIIMREADDCNISGCVLASAFFPDSGRHDLTLYPRMFTQPRDEQVETMIHEIGHIFGLRHFFAPVGEAGFPSQIFGKHDKFTIMNYGANSELSPNDVADLRTLYQQAWAGELTHVNGTPIRLVKPFHTLAGPTDSAFALAAARA